MKSIKLILLTGFLLALGANTMAQPGGKQGRERIQAQKVAFITNKLSLTPEEAQVFWPVYNEYEKKQKALRKEKRGLVKNGASIEELPDKDIETRVDAFIDLGLREANLKKEYHDKFKATLPIRKVAKLYRAEEAFNRQLMNRLKENRGKGQGGRSGPQ